MNQKLLSKPRTYDLDEAVFIAMHPALHDSYWSLAGMHLTPELRMAWKLPSEEEEKAGLAAPVGSVRIPYTHHDYSVVNNYLVPYYQSQHSALARRSEGRIISRSRAWILNAEPQLNINRTEAEIDELATRFSQNIEQMNPSDAHAMNAKCAEFRQLFGAIMTRFEQLGRVLKQGNTSGSTIYFPEHSEPSSENFTEQRELFPEQPGKVMQPAEADQYPGESLSPEQLQKLRNEFAKYYTILMKPECLPLMRLVRLTDFKIDPDGVLIDWMRESVKPLLTQDRTDEHQFNDNLLNKASWAMGSIDQIHNLMIEAMTKGESGKLFRKAADAFIASHGTEYSIEKPEDILKKLDDFTALCRARCGIKSADAKGFDSIYPNLAALDDFFNSAGGFLQTVRHQHRAGAIMSAEQEYDASHELSTLRSQLTRGIKLMSRTSYTRIPCNENAPEIWIPDFESADPIEAHMANNLLSEHEKKYAKRCVNAASGLPANDGEKYLKQQLCSVGQLGAALKELETTLKRKQASQQTELN